ncbi:hypothetical protein [Paenibacillus sp. USHLN196]|uniref:hypothetical protein n=1 Tax=Paenibacillus sp. USHLN196 TaxID=3081291 RepID=UPI00301975B6
MNTHTEMEQLVNEYTRGLSSLKILCENDNFWNNRSSDKKELVLSQLEEKNDPRINDLVHKIRNNIDFSFDLGDCLLVYTNGKFQKGLK